MVGPKKQDFWPEINLLKENHCILRIWGAVRQKLGMILESKVVQKLKLEENVFYKKWSPKLIFFHNSSQDNFKKKSFGHVDSWAKILS